MTPSLREYAELQEIARERKPKIALVLGSGLNDLADRLEDAVELPFELAPGLDAPSVAGHRGVFVLGTWANVPVLVCAGRLHYYEGHPWRRVVQPIHVLHDLGATILVVTNAAGGVRDDLEPGDLMAISAHRHWTHPNWWRAKETANPYSERCSRLLKQSADQCGFPLATGVYAQLTGPSYETHAEIRALRICGVDAVGMSTAREIQTGRDLGMECAALSCITNKAAGPESGPIHHGEVLTVANSAREKLAALLELFLKGI